MPTTDTGAGDPYTIVDVYAIVTVLVVVDCGT